MPTTSLPAGSLPINDNSGFKNRIINGGMTVWQRGTSFLNITDTGQIFQADRWFSVIGSAATNIVQSSSVPQGFVNSLKIGRTQGQTTASYHYIAQNIEFVNFADLAGQTITISFWAKAGTTFSGTNIGTDIYTGTERDQGGNGGVWGFWVGSVNSTTTFNISTTWTRYSWNCTIPANAQSMAFDVGYGSAGTAGADDYLYLTGIQIEKNTGPTNFEVRTFSTELQMCQRYYWRDGWTVSGGGQKRYFNGYMYSTAQWESTLVFPVEMRVPPTLSYSALSTFTVNYSVTPTSLNLYTPTTKAGLLYTANPVTSSIGMSVPLATTVTNGQVSFIALSAEL